MLTFDIRQLKRRKLSEFSIKVDNFFVISTRVLWGFWVKWNCRNFLRNKYLVANAFPSQKIPTEVGGCCEKMILLIFIFAIRNKDFF